jgi:ABC-2 type transport system permease protein
MIGAYFLSIGTFASTLTKNQIIAAILAFAMLIPVFSAGLLETLSNDPSKSETLGYFNLWDHMEEFARGVVDTRRVVYYVSATAFFLFLTTISLSAKREAP